MRVRPDLALHRRQAPVRRRADDPGCSEIVQPPSPTRQPRQLSPSITSTESLTAWPDRLVPAARKVSGVFSSWHSASRRTSSASLSMTTISSGTRR